MLMQKNYCFRSPRSGFTLIETLLVVAAIAILASIIIIAINPSKQLSQTKNAQRQANISTIINAVYQYAIDNNGELPADIPVGSCENLFSNEICRTDAASCDNLVSLGELTADKEYLVKIPVDPIGATSNGAGYHITSDGNKRVTVCAPDAELSETIEVSL